MRRAPASANVSNKKSADGSSAMRVRENVGALLERLKRRPSKSESDATSAAESLPESDAGPSKKRRRRLNRSASGATLDDAPNTPNDAQS